MRDHVSGDRHPLAGARALPRPAQQPGRAVQAPERRTRATGATTARCWTRSCWSRSTSR
jgi:hypothetical protein